MIYNEFKGKSISALGMGCMRFPCINGENNNIDKEATREMIAYAMKKGINYFDTAWGYHSGMSEPTMGELLSEYPRESFYLASKFPGYDLNLIDKVEEIFEKQLERCKTEYFDFYLFHNLCEANVDGYLDEKLGIFDYLMKQKKNGRIKHLGFSTHGSLHTIKRFLEAYGKDMEFCQLQINWLDWDLQKAKEKVELATSYGIPVWVMEPVRGGKIATLAPEHEARLRALRPDASMAEWAFRFIQTIPEVTVTLSGMSNFDQLKENIETYEAPKPLSKVEIDTLFDISKDIIAKTAIHCTACRYCTAHCPMELDIPELIKIYNEHAYSESGTIPSSALDAIDESKRPSSCIGCRACEELCPQCIKISDMMTEFTDRLK